MTDSLLDRYATRRPDQEPTDDSPEDHGAFGYLRGTRDQATMLELRFKTGNITAIGYAWIEKIDFDPSVGITLHYLGQKVTLKGRHLNTETRPNVRLFQGLTRHRVPWVAEETRSMAHSSEATAIEQIC